MQLLGVEGGVGDKQRTGSEVVPFMVRVHKGLGWNMELNTFT